MTKDQAAKLAQAYKWLSEGKDVDYYNGQKWLSWYGCHVDWTAYRLTPEPLLECWANVQTMEHRYFSSAAAAKKLADASTRRIAVHMREVRPEPNT